MRARFSGAREGIFVLETKMKRREGRVRVGSIWVRKMWWHASYKRWKWKFQIVGWRTILFNNHISSHFPTDMPGSLLHLLLAAHARTDAK